MGSHRWKNGLLYTLTMLMLAPTLGACASVKTVEWTEDVKLSDGRTIVVQRANDYRRVMDAGAGFQRGWNFERASISAELPPPLGRRVFWQGLMSPIVIEMLHDGEVYLVGVPTPIGSDEWRVPQHEFYVAFKLVTGEWKRIALVDMPQTLHPNLFVSSYTYFIEQAASPGSHVDLSIKERLDSNPLIGRRYRTLIRLPNPSKK
jgi:hypothetical protein